MQRVKEHLAEAGVTAEITILESTAKTAALAAEQLGVPVGAIANSLIFESGGEPLLVLTSGAHRVDTDALADRLDLVPLNRAQPEFVRTHTGQAIGGVSPVGHPKPIRTLVDVTLADHVQVWVAAGHPSSVFPTTCDELVRLTGGQLVDVA